MKRLTTATPNGYFSANKKQELVDKLAKYEDLGYQPEDLELLLEAVYPDTIIELMRVAKKEGNSR